MQAIQITDGRTSLWQWDTGVSIKVYGCTDVDQMHFVTPGGIISRDLVGGECGVPDAALQTEGLLKMYAFDRTENGGVTRRDFLLMVKARPKPADYIDPPDEYDNLEALAERVASLIPGGGGEPVTPEQIQKAVDNYLTENPVQVEETDPTVPGWAKAKQKPSYTAEEVGAQPKGDYALKSDIPEILVKSVNGKTGDVVLTAQNVGALPADAEIVDQTARDGVATLSEENGLLSTALANMTIEGYEQDSASGFFDVKDLAEKHEGEYCYDSGTIKSVAIAGWNWYALPVKVGEKYSVTTKHGGSARACFLTDDGGKVKERYPAVKEEFGAVETFEFTIPDGVSMLYCNEQPSAQVLALKKAGKLSGVPHFKRTENSFADSDHLCGKLLAFVGDSITEATNPDGGYFENYAEIAAKRHGMSVYKDGKGGSTMANTADHRPFCVDRYLNVPEYDILTIWFGWNDAAYSQIGTIDDTEDTTFYGAYKKVLEYFITAYPTKKIGLIVPYGNASVEPFRVAVRALSEMYGVPCLDLADGKQCSLLWGTANAAQEARRAALTYDSTHPNQAGHEYLSTMYEEFIKRL